MTENLSVTILGAPGPILFFSDDEMVLECLAIGNPPPRVSWDKILPGGSRVMRVANGTELRFSRTLLDDGGRYVCVVENCLSNRVESEAVEVEVRQRLKFQSLTVSFTGTYQYSSIKGAIGSFNKPLSGPKN